MTIRHSLGQVANDLASILQTRCELFSVELADQRVRFISLLCLFGATFVFLFLAMVVFSIFFISLFWPSELRYVAIGGLTLTYALIGLSQLWRLMYRLKTDALPFEMTRKEFANDLATFKQWHHSQDKSPHYHDHRADLHEG